MFDAFDSRVGSVFNRDGEGDVACEWQAHFGRLFCYGEEHFAWSMVMDLDEVHSEPSQFAHGLYRLLSIANSDPVRKVWWCVIDNWSCSDDLRTRERT